MRKGDVGVHTERKAEENEGDMFVLLGREERGDERRQEGVRSLPVAAFHLAIHSVLRRWHPACPVCGLFQRVCK